MQLPFLKSLEAVSENVSEFLQSDSDFTEIWSFALFVGIFPPNLSEFLQSDLPLYLIHSQKMSEQARIQIWK